MKTLKRISTFALAVAMVFTSAIGIGTTTAFAAEAMPEECEIVENTSEVVENITISPRTNSEIADDTFNIVGYHKGGSRYYYCNYVWIFCSFKNANGTALPEGSTILAVRLYDDTTSTFVGEWQSSSGLINQRNISVVSGHKYHWEYIVAYGTQNLQLRSQLTGYDSPLS